MLLRPYHNFGLSLVQAVLFYDEIWKSSTKKMAKSESLYESIKCRDLDNNMNTENI